LVVLLKQRRRESMIPAGWLATAETPAQYNFRFRA
jgi:hypothetical protein